MYLFSNIYELQSSLLTSSINECIKIRKSLETRNSSETWIALVNKRITELERRN